MPDALIRLLHHPKPAPAWSVIVTIFGDAVAPRGGELWLGSLSAIAAGLGIDAGAVRTALTRLASDGLVARRRVGRESFVRLDPSVAAEFAHASERIYFEPTTHWRGRWRLAVVEDGAAEPTLRRALREEGYGALAAGVFLAPAADEAWEHTPRAGVLRLEASGAVAEAPRLAAMAFHLDAIASDYAGFVEDFTPIARGLAAEPRLDPAQALLARLVLVHAFRRIVLRHPHLPVELLPHDWPGRAARKLAAEIYGAVRDAAERWLDGARNAEGRLPRAGRELARRFAPHVLRSRS